MSDNEGASNRLIRQQLRRRQGIPTLSVLAGDRQQAIALWRHWAQVTGKTVRLGKAQDYDRLLQWQPSSQNTALLLYDAHNTNATLLISLLQKITQLIENHPTLSIALAVNPATIANCQHALPECHSKAILREGMISLANTAARLVEDVSGTRYENTARLLQTQATPELLLTPFYAAIEALEAYSNTDTSRPTRASERARSAAEQFLFEVLQSHPETVDRFALNATCDFIFGNTKAEVDLLAQQPKIAIEIDGYYHFQHPDRFRRDRRKDFELQAQGYMVLRFLAEDVVTQLETILTTIFKAIRLKGNTHA